MKRILLVLCLCVAPLGPIGCNSSPSERVQAVTTLKAIGLSVDAAMKVSAQLLKDGKINGEQWGKIAVAHARFQQAFKLAISAVQSDLTPASPDLIKLGGELLSIVATYQPKAS